MRIFSIIFFVFAVFTASFSQAKPVPVEHYARLPAIWDGSISPDGKYLATVINSGGGYILRVYNIADKTDKKQRAMRIGAGVKVLWVKWANNKQLLFSTQQVENYGGQTINTGYLYVSNIDLTDSNILIKPRATGSAGSSHREVVLIDWTVWQLS